MPVCSSCGQVSPEGFRFCGACGAELTAPEVGAPHEERRTLTVLFADLVGFTTLADRLDPEDLRRLIGPIHDQLRFAVEHLGGTVEKFIGDAVMAVFGVPAAHEDDPERAVRAALAIRDAVAELAGGDAIPELAVRIGVNTGEALVDPDLAPGEGERIVADFVNVASRLETAAPSMGILVGEATYLATARAIEYRAFPPVKAKGKPEPILAWEAVEARARIGGDPGERGRAPLVGRLDEVQLLCDTFARVRREHSAQLVTLIGPPGIGKSRLVQELFTVVDDDPELVFWRRGACPPYGEGVTFSPLAEMVKAQAGILDTDSTEDVAEKLRREVADCIAEEDEAAWVEEHLRLLLGLAHAAGGRTDLGESFAAWRRFFESLAEQSPAVLVFEDLHWAGESLLDFIDHLVEWAIGVPLLVVCTARPELLSRRSDWGGGKQNAVSVALSPLTDVETEELLDELLEQAVLPSELKSALLARAGGNPLYAEEFVRMLAERGSPAKGDELPVPASVQGIVAARLDTLPPEEKAVLQDAAIVGRVFWLGALSHLGGVPHSALDERLRSLERKQFVLRNRRASREGEAQYAFRHLLVLDVAYARIPRARRIEKHRLAAEWIESLGRPEEHAETVAHHYARALELARASGRDTRALAERTRLALREAGDRAAALKGFAAAARLYAQALELWPQDDPGRAAVLFGHARACYHAEEADPALLAGARDALLAAGDRERAAEAEVFLGKLAFRSGQHDLAFAHSEQALSLLEGAPASASKARALSALARMLVVGARSEDGIRVAQEALAIAQELRLPELEASSLMTIGDARIELGDLGGMLDFERGIAMATELSTIDAIAGYVNLADTVTDLGDMERAVELRQQAQRTAERFGDATMIRWLRAERCGEAYALGRWNEALQLADDFIDESEAGRRHYQEGYCRVVRGRIRLARGETAAALDDAARAVEFSRVVQDPQALYPALAFQARALAATGRPAEAGEPADELLGLVAESGKTPVAYLWLLDAALALADTGRGEELRTATAEVRKPTPWLTAALAIASGHPAEAARTYARMGARSDEASAHLRAAQASGAAGRRAEAEAELEAARAFFDAVGATASLAPVERLLVAPA